MADGADIIIKGGSVELVYDETVYPQNPTDRERHSNPNKKITRIVITGDLTYDSGEFPDGVICQINTICD